MKYIVFKEPYLSYNIPQGGYFVKYKDKLCDEFSTNWFDASRYKSLGGAISRLGIYGLNLSTIDSFIESNLKEIKSRSLFTTAKRDIKLSKILDEKIDIANIISYKGRIEKISDEGENLGDATDEVIEFIMSKIRLNFNKFNQRVKYAESLAPSTNYIDNEVDEDFWNDWINS